MEAMTSKRGQNAGRSWEDLPVVEVAKPKEEPAQEVAAEVVEEEMHPVDDGTMDDAAWMKQMMSGTLEDEVAPEPAKAGEGGESKTVEVVSSSGRPGTGAEDVSRWSSLLLCITRSCVSLQGSNTEERCDRL